MEILGPKNLIYPNLRYNKNFSQKMGYVTFLCLLNPGKKMSQSRENGVKYGRTELNSLELNLVLV